MIYEEKHIPIDTAKALKGIGYPQKWYTEQYSNDIVYVVSHLSGDSELECVELTTREKAIEQCPPIIIDAPRYTEVVDWFRDMKNINIVVDFIGERNWLPTIQFVDLSVSEDIIVEGSETKIGGNGFDSFEKAVNAAILKACEALDKNAEENIKKGNWIF